jgi:hypothetical protein
MTKLRKSVSEKYWRIIAQRTRRSYGDLSRSWNRTIRQVERSVPLSDQRQLNFDRLVAWPCSGSVQRFGWNPLRASFDKGKGRGREPWPLAAGSLAEV